MVSNSCKAGTHDFNKSNDISCIMKFICYNNNYSKRIFILTIIFFLLSSS